MWWIELSAAPFRENPWEQVVALWLPSASCVECSKVDEWTNGKQLIEISSQLPSAFIIMIKEAVKHWWESLFKW